MSEDGKYSKNFQKYVQVLDASFDAELASNWVSFSFVRYFNSKFECAVDNKRIFLDEVYK